MNGPNKLECLPLADHSKNLECLRVRLGGYEK